MKELLYGAAYYDEYMPYDRLDKDVEMMKKAGINTVRIAESTWSTCEPQPGIFDFSHVERVMDAMEAAGINVIIGTPTYAVPTWMVKAHPEVLAETVRGRGIYGARQIMDITHPVYLFYAERVIRELMKRTAHRKCVIGFQVDNETKYYGTAGKNVQEQFVKYGFFKCHLWLFFLHPMPINIFLTLICFYMVCFIYIELPVIVSCQKYTIFARSGIVHCCSHLSHLFLKYSLRQTSTPYHLTQR